MYHVSCIKSNNRGEKEEIRWIMDRKIEGRMVKLKKGTG